jgi:TRAP-type C4-dicarboxylate transport system permease small subunit
VLAFFVVLALAGMRVLSVLGGTSLVSLPWVPAAVAQSVIPIGAVLFIVAQIVSLPDALRGTTHAPDDGGAEEGGAS